MTNEEFQRIVIGKLGSIDSRVENMENEQQTMGKELLKIKKDIKSIIEQTSELSEFRYEINGKIDRLVDEFNTVEIVTSKNWNDIARLKAAR